MGKKKSTGSKRNTVEIKRGITVVELKRSKGCWRDLKGREYTEYVHPEGSTFCLKDAQFVTSKVLLGICDKNKRHRLHTDTMPRSKKCSCGGEYIFTDLKAEGVDVPQVKTSAEKAMPTPKKKKRGK